MRTGRRRLAAVVGPLAVLSLTLVLTLVLTLGSTGCSPQTGSVDGGAEDFSQLSRDLASCDPVPGNALENPGFETPSATAPAGNGQASNRGNPASTIPGGKLGPWDGCCDQGAGMGGTTWTVGTTLARCGTRAVTVASDGATSNVLSQRLDLATSSGHSFRASAWVLIGRALTGTQLALDVFDLTTNQVVATSLALTATTADWRYVSFMGTVPTGGSLQLRIKSTGTFTAVVDDLALVPQ